MSDFTHWHPEIEGWSEDILPFYAELAETLPDGAVFVEVGVAYGRSLLFLADELEQRSKHQCVIYGVEPLVTGTLMENLAAFRESVRRLICLITEPSVVAAAYAPPAVAVVFLDGDHRKEAVSKDIAAWLPKVWSWGILAGHDYGAPEHPGVKLAVDEAFPEGIELRGTVWIRKEKNA